MRLNLHSCLEFIFTFAAIVTKANSTKNPQETKLLTDALPKECASFELIYGNLSKANNVILAEHHDRGAQTIECIEALTANIGKHDILLEGAQSNVSYNCEQLGFNKNIDRKCFGWDDEKAWSDARDAIYQQEIQLANLPMTEESHNIYRKSELTEKEQHCKRGLSLINSIENNKNSEIKKFVIVGAGHIRPIKPNFYDEIDDVACAEYVQSEIKKNNKTNPTAVLFIKSEKENDYKPF